MRHIGVVLNWFLQHECQAYPDNAEYCSALIHHALTVAGHVEERDRPLGFLKVKA